jgi:hypothetical protein
MFGSINEDINGTMCTHFIELYTPLMENGQSVSLCIGLAEGFAANLIVGLPFGIRARLVIYLADSYVFSQTFQRTFPIEYLPAISLSTVPHPDNVSIPTFLTSPFDPIPDPMVNLPNQEK